VHKHKHNIHEHNIHEHNIYKHNINDTPRSQAKPNRMSKTPPSPLMPHVTKVSEPVGHEPAAVAADPRKGVYVLHSCPTYTANALRRVLLSELMCPGFPNAYAHDTRKHRGARSTGPNAAADVTDADGSTVDTAGSGVHIKTNTGRLHNEILRHRLAMLPLALDPTTLRDASGSKLLLRLRVQCAADAESPRHVTSEDIQLVRCNTTPSEHATDNDDNDDDDDGVVHDLAPYLLPGATQLIPTDPVAQQALQSLAVTNVSDRVPSGILITRLYPDESLDVELYPGVGCARHFAGYSPLHTCTYEQLDVDDPTSRNTPLHDFRFTLQTLGAYSADELFQRGLGVLQRKVRVFRELLQPKTFEIDFGSTAHPALHMALSTTSTSTANGPRACWVQWADVDYLTRLRAPEVFYQKHCHEVLAATTAADEPLLPKYSQDQRIPSVDGEDLVDNTSSLKKHVLALHQPAFDETGIYEYVPSSREFRAIPEAEATFVIVKEGRTKRARVFTKAEILEAEDTRCVLRFGKSVPANVADHIRSHIEGVVCAGASDGDPPVHLGVPAHVRPDIQIERSADATCFSVMVPQEDHTLGNLVQGWVYDRFLRTDQQRPHKATTPSSSADADAHGLCALGYKQPLPSERTILFRAEFSKSIGSSDGLDSRIVSVFSGWLDAVHQHVSCWCA